MVNDNNKPVRSFNTSKALLLAAAMLAYPLHANSDKFYLAMNAPDQVTVSPTTQASVYSLKSTQDLSTSNWTEIATSRGTESNLVFTLDSSSTDLPTNFFSASSTYSPLNPTNFEVAVPHSPHQDGPTYYGLDVCNYKTNPINVRFTYTEIDNPRMIPYSNDMPFVRTLVPGDQRVTTTFYWPRGNGTGGSVYGNIGLEEVLDEE